MRNLISKMAAIFATICAIALMAFASPAGASDHGQGKALGHDKPAAASATNGNNPNQSTYQVDTVKVPTPSTPAEDSHREQSDGCDHGASGKPCKPDPQPDHGQDCLTHGNNAVGGVNEDHCGPSEITPPDDDATVAAPVHGRGP